MEFVVHKVAAGQAFRDVAGEGGKHGASAVTIRPKGDFVLYRCSGVFVRGKIV